jgi:recombination protein RecR
MTIAGPEIERLVQLLARLPGLGPRSARRAVLYLLKRREVLLGPLVAALSAAQEHVRTCSVCGNLDSSDPCLLCADSKRDDATICVVEDVSSLWALERSGVYRGRYHVLGGVLSALDGVGPDDLNVESLIARAMTGPAKEIILAIGATVDGHTTAHYLNDRLKVANIAVSTLALGLPVGGELDYLDDGTIGAALKARRAL